MRATTADYADSNGCRSFSPQRTQRSRSQICLCVLRELCGESKLGGGVREIRQVRGPSTQPALSAVERAQDDRK
jgi:hypothetical protein